MSIDKTLVLCLPSSKAFKLFSTQDRMYYKTNPRQQSRQEDEYSNGSEKAYGGAFINEQGDGDAIKATNVLQDYRTPII